MLPFFTHQDRLRAIFFCIVESALFRYQTISNSQTFYLKQHKKSQSDHTDWLFLLWMSWYLSQFKHHRFIPSEAVDDTT